MKLEKSDVEKLAHLARLEFNEKEKEEMLDDMDKIIGFVEKIDELDLEGIEPLVYITEEGGERLREDKTGGELSKDDALKNAPDKDTDYFRVQKVLKREQD